MTTRRGVIHAIIVCFPFIVLDLFEFWNYLRVGWIFDAHGTPHLYDFLSLWVAGRNPLTAYDLQATKAAQAALTQISAEFLPFNYPPHFLLGLILLAKLPYGAAFVLFQLASTALYAWSVVKISGRREAAVFALAMPGFVACLIIGQTGCFAAALAGLALLASKSPAVPGLALAALSFKPQFGPLFPIALALDRRWRVLAVAVVGISVSLAAAYWILGASTFTSFYTAIRYDADFGLTRGMDHVEKMQNVYGVVRSLGASALVGWTAQALAMLGCVAALLSVHRRSRSNSLHNAALLACVPLFSPHVLIYDLVLVSPAIAFLWRDRPLSSGEWYALAGATVITCIFFFYTAPVGIALPLTALVLAILR